MRHGLFSLVAGKRAREAASEPRILLYESEAIRIAQYARSSPRLEIGGDLLGFYAPDGSPLVFVASGPGPAARRDATHFQQDPEFQATIFNQLASKFRMFYVGDWHSHHGLGLSDPSGPDDAKLQDLASKNGWPQLFSLIVQTEFPGGRLDSHARHRDEISRRDSYRGGPHGPIETFGVWWNAFQYIFSEREHVRHRVAIEFQAGENPYHATSESINASLERRPHLRRYEAGGQASGDLHPPETQARTGITTQGDEFTLTTYQEICRLLSRELHGAEMEVDLESYGVGRLLVFDGGKKVVCNILGSAHAPLAVTVESAGRKQIAFEVPCPRDQLDPVDIRRIVVCIIEQFKPSTDLESPGGRAG